jgi:hypothetical protein
MGTFLVVYFDAALAALVVQDSTFGGNMLDEVLTNF